ncbi:PhoX family protein [Arcobacter sp.]|uniref:PhoX family protein n=1 Tax=Arcobacter sp. TaxID=1872629 RepID=UPI003D11F2BA
MNKKVFTLSIVVATTVFSGCTKNEVSKQEVKPSHKLAFSEVSVPTKDYEKRRVRPTSAVTLDGKTKKIGFNTILRSGDKVGDGIYGMIFDVNGQPIYEKDGAVKISNSNDFSSLIPVGDKLFMISHFETRPATMYLTELEQSKDGYLKPISTKNIDFSSVNGLWVPCAGSVTPWSSHLGSEEYEPNAAKVKANGSINDYYDQMADYYEGNLQALNPYDYGWTPEIKILNEKGDVNVTKHYAMGRFAHELSYVMPDEKTVFLSDDGTNVGLFMFVADKKRDLSSGTLYAAKWEQRSNKGAGSADLKWVNLGHSSNTQIKKALDKKLTFKNIFESAKANEEMSCPSSFTSINTTMGHECLKVKDGMDEVASRLESRRYAAIKGATTEFRKMEGITYNSNDNILYLSMSAIAYGMEDSAKKGKENLKYDGGGNNDIRLKYNACGAVYGLNMLSFSNAHDLNGSKIESKFVPNFMYSLVEGKPDKSVEGNTCSLDSLANPDNITYIPNTKTLIIGEDSGSGHQNDFIWSYNLEDKKLTRILTTPYGSETTSPYYYNNIGGHGYLMTVVQHPYGEGDALTKEEDMPSKASDVRETRAYTGYFGPLPVITK